MAADQDLLDQDASQIRFLRFINAVQVAVGYSGDVRTLLDRLHAAVSLLGISSSLTERVAARGVVACVLCRAMLAAPDIDRDLLLAVANRSLTLGDLGEAFHQLHNGFKLSGLDERVKATVSLISARFTTTSLTIESAAKFTGVSRWHLARLLRQATGTTFSHLLRDHRLRIAAELLKVPGVSIKEVAAKVGYSSPTLLSREFKRTHGLSPKRWRQVHSTGA